MLSCIARPTGSQKISGRLCHGISPRSIPISRCSTSRTRRLQRLRALVTSRARKGYTMFTLETCTIAKVAARGVRAAATFSSSATGTSSANGTLKTLVVDRVATKLPAFSNMSMAIGVRGDCRCGSGRSHRSVGEAVWFPIALNGRLGASYRSAAKAQSKRFEASEHFFGFGQSFQRDATADREELVPHCEHVWIFVRGIDRFV